MTDPLFAGRTLAELKKRIDLFHFYGTTRNFIADLVAGIEQRDEEIARLTEERNGLKLKVEAQEFKAAPRDLAEDVPEPTFGPRDLTFANLLREIEGKESKWPDGWSNHTVRDLAAYIDRLVHQVTVCRRLLKEGREEIESTNALADMTIAGLNEDITKANAQIATWRDDHYIVLKERNDLSLKLSRMHDSFLVDRLSQELADAKDIIAGETDRCQQWTDDCRAEVLREVAVAWSLCDLPGDTYATTVTRFRVMLHEIEEKTTKPQEAPELRAGCQAASPRENRCLVCIHRGNCDPSEPGACYFKQEAPPCSPSSSPSSASDSATSSVEKERTNAPGTTATNTDGIPGGTRDTVAPAETRESSSDGMPPLLPGHRRITAEDTPQEGDLLWASGCWVSRVYATERFSPGHLQAGEYSRPIERTCETCKYSEVYVSEEPCYTCTEDDTSPRSNFPKWAAKAEPVLNDTERTSPKTATEIVFEEAEKRRQQFNRHHTLAHESAAIRLNDLSDGLKSLTQQVLKMHPVYVATTQSERVPKIEERLSNLESEIESHVACAKVVALEGSVGSVEERLTELEGKVERIISQVAHGETGPRKRLGVDIAEWLRFGKED